MKISHHLLALTFVAIPFVSHAESMDKPHCDHLPAMTFDAGKLPEGQPPMHGLPPYLAGLELTDAQQDKIFALTYALLPQIREHGKQRHQLMDALRQLSNAEPFDEARAKQIADKLASLEKEVMIKRAQIDSQIFALLTTEQRKLLSERRTHHEGFSRSGFESRMHSGLAAKRVM